MSNGTLASGQNRYRHKQCQWKETQPNINKQTTKCIVDMWQKNGIQWHTKNRLYTCREWTGWFSRAFFFFCFSLSLSRVDVIATAIRNTTEEFLQTHTHIDIYVNRGP